MKYIKTIRYLIKQISNSNRKQSLYFNSMEFINFLTDFNPFNKNNESHLSNNIIHSKDTLNAFISI
jgi:hypothetical protein